MESLLCNAIESSYHKKITDSDTIVYKLTHRPHRNAQLRKNTYIKEFNSGYQTWLQHKYVGGGIKSFRFNCVTYNCSSHPHNYYLEILTELGLIGFFLISIIFSIVLFRSFFNQQTNKTNLSYNKVITPFMFLFLIEIFPVKSTGSFFTTGNATYLFLIMSITIALSQPSSKKN